MLSAGSHPRISTMRSDFNSNNGDTSLIAAHPSRSRYSSCDRPRSGARSSSSSQPNRSRRLSRRILCAADISRRRLHRFSDRVRSVAIGFSAAIVVKREPSNDKVVRPRIPSSCSHATSGQSSRARVSRFTSLATVPTSDSSGASRTRRDAKSAWPASQAKLVASGRAPKVTCFRQLSLKPPRDGVVGADRDVGWVCGGW